MPTFLIVILCILAALVAIILLLLFVPASVLLQYANDTIVVKARVLFITIKLYPRKPKKEEKEEPTEQPQQDAPQEPQPEEPKEKPKRKITLDKISRIVKTASGAMKKIFKNLKITFTKVVWPVYSGDASDTAVAYGQLQAYFGGALGVLQQFLNIKFKSVNIFADFDNKHEKERCIYCKIGATPFIIISAALYVFNRLKRDKLI